MSLAGLLVFAVIKPMPSLYTHGKQNHFQESLSFDKTYTFKSSDTNHYCLKHILAFQMLNFF